MTGSQAVIHDLKQRSRGDVIEVTLKGSSANVRLMDSTNLSRYKRGANHKCRGGFVTKSPVHLTVPSSGHWYVVVDLLGLKKGQTRSTTRILPEADGTDQAVIESIAICSDGPAGAPLTTIAIDRDAEKSFDVFISHASEDKDDVVRSLAHALVAKGLEVWYDEFELKIGDSLRQKIDFGLARSKAGIVVLSDDFFRKGWPNYELDGLVTNNVAGKQKLLPIWHGLSHDEVRSHSPSLADKVARNTDDFTIEQIAAEIADVIHEQ